MRHRLLLRGTLFALLLGPPLLALVAGLTLDRLDRRGRRFYDRGRQVVDALDRLAAALAARDLEAVASSYAPDFHGTSLGLANPVPEGETDGVTAFRFVPTAGEVDRAAAVAAWGEYLSGLETIDEVGLHLERLTRWEDAGGARGRLEAEVRFELRGRPRGAARAGVDRVLFRAAFRRGAGERLRLVATSPLPASTATGVRRIAQRPRFHEVGHAAGVDFVQRYYPPFLTLPLRFRMIRYGPGGISAADFDGDGFYDLFIPDGVESRLLRNRGDGTFEDVTDSAGLGGLDGVSVGVFADYDNDGRRDLFVSRTFRPNQLFHNEGPNAEGIVTFRDVTKGSGLGEDACTSVASWGDYDGDGRLDLYLGRYLDPRKDIPTTFYARNGEPNRLYHNDGGGHFTDVTESAGVGDPGLCLGSVWGDYDDDGDPDLYVVNDFGRNTLYRNDGDGRFTDVTVASGTLDYGAGMSASFGDVDGDGRLDLYVANIRSEHAWFAEAPTVERYLVNSLRQGTWPTDMPLYFEIWRQSGNRFVQVFQQMSSGNTLLRNRGDGTFEDITRKAAANPVGWFWGSALGDLDLDGDLDIYSADGWVYNDPHTEIELDFLNDVVGDQRKYKSGVLFDPKYFGRLSWHGWERNCQLRNRGDGTFEEVSGPEGSDLLRNSRGVALADFRNRGVLDIAVATSHDRPALLANTGPGDRHWLEMELIGTRSNRDGVGARVTVRAAGRKMVREVVAGDGYASQSMLRLHFGLGDSPVAEEVVVDWPASGIRQRFTDVAGDRIVAVTEGGGLVERRYGADRP